MLQELHLESSTYRYEAPGLSEIALARKIMHLGLFTCCLNKIVCEPITVAAHSNAGTVSAVSNAGVVGSNSFRGMDACVCVCVCVHLQRAIHNFRDSCCHLFKN
jgi:hypothetical protein